MERNKAKCFITILVLHCLLCCTANKGEWETQFSISYIKQDFNIDSLLHVSRIIQLKSPNNESLIKSIHKLIFVEDNVVVVDSKRLVLFDSEGNYIKSTGSMIGKGRNEYVTFMDVTLDEYKKEIYMLADVPRKIFVFDKDLNLLRTQNYEVCVLEIAVDSTSLYCLTLNNSQDRYDLLCSDKNDLGVALDTLASNKRVCVGLFSEGQSITNNGKVFACLPFDNVIYELCNGKILQKYVIDNRDRWYSAGVNENISDFLRHSEGMNWSYKDIYQIDSTIMLTSCQSTFFVVDANIGTGIEYTGFSSPYVPFLYQFITPMSGLPNSIAFNLLESDLTWYKEHPESYKTINDLAIKDLVENYDESGNPMILVWTTNKN